MEEEPNQEIFPGFFTVDSYTKKGFQVLLEATKSSNAIPTQREWDFYKTYDNFNKILNREGDKILRLMNNVLHNKQQNVNIRNRDIDEKMELLIEANDNILEKVALGIDELNGIKKNTQEAIEIQTVSAQLPVNGSWNQLNKATFSVSSSIDNMKNSSGSLNSIRLLTAKNIIRPQTYFKDKIDNRNVPWIPRITEKPNSIKPLAIFLEESEYGETYSHPYELELERFTSPPSQLVKANPVTVKRLDKTPLVEVSTPEQLAILLEELRKHTEFAVDLEHHSYRTFMGITCLLQISTKDADYLIDTFALRDKLYVLNEVFTKPTIVKILHGANCDIQWLQRDLSLYVVNMFDTHQAAKRLGYSGLSLAYLLNRFCNVVPNKHFQLADWRIRPLPEELKTYARMDTHYLIYIYHILRNELLKRGNGSDNILKAVIHESTEICKTRYIKPILRDDSYMDYYRKCKRLFDNRQLSALKDLFQWRDSLARAQDESTGYVLPNHMLLQISELLPREIQGILACCNPIPPLVRANLIEIHQIIFKAREQSTVKPVLKEDTRSKGSTFQFTKLNVDSPLHCPHDISKAAEFRDDLPTLLGTGLKNHDKRANQFVSIENIKSKYSAFSDPNISEEEDNEAIVKIQNISFLAPYERYELIKPFIQEQEENDAAAAAAASKTTDNKTEQLSNEDRIAALHDHFVKVSTETLQIPANETVKKGPSATADTVSTNVSIFKTPPQKTVPLQHQTLKSMCGSKKRKRNVTDEDDDFLYFKKPCGEMQDVSATEDTVSPNVSILETPPWKTVPLQQQTVKSMCGSKKRNKNVTKEDSNLHNFKRPNEMQDHTYTPNLKKNKQSNKQKKQTTQNNIQQSTGIHDNNSDVIAGTSQKGNGSNKKKASNKKNASNKTKASNKMKFNKKQNQLQQKSNKQNQQSFTPFDYSSVNFQEFQGGASRACNKRGPFKSEFRGRNKKKKTYYRNSNNKSMTYNRHQQQ